MFTQIMLCPEDDASLVSPLSLVLKTFSSPLFHSSLGLEGRGIIKTSPLELSAAQSLTLCKVYSCGLCVNYHLLKEASLRRGR